MITIVRDSKYGDWIAIYKDDDLLMQGHSFYPDEILEALGYETSNLDGDTDATGNHFPPKLTNVVPRT